MPHIQMLTRIAISMTSNMHDAQDLVQDTLLRAYRGIDGFDGRYPRAWLLTIMRNTLASRFKPVRIDVSPWIDIEAHIVEGQGREHARPENQVLQKEFVDAVVRVVSELEDHHREVVTLVDLVGLSYQEAAEFLDIPVGTVMSRLHRARLRIRRKLAQTGLVPPVPEVNTDE